MTRGKVFKVTSALFLVKVIGHEHILATKFPSLGTWRKAKWHFWVVRRGPGGTIRAPMGSHGGQGPLKGGPLGGSCGPKGDFWGTLGSQGRPTLWPRDAQGEPRDAIGRPRQAKGGTREAKMGHQEHPGSTKMGPKWTWPWSKHKM